MPQLIDNPAQDEATQINPMPFRTKSVLELMDERPDPNIINGVYVPLDVQIQLRELGISLEAFTEGELKKAIAADSDGRVIDDANGATLDDKESLTEDEIQKQAATTIDPDDDGDDDDDLPTTLSITHKLVIHTAHKPQQTFCQRLLEQRQHTAESIAAGDPCACCSHPS